MSFEDTYYCYHCGFTFKTEDVFFFINDDGKLEEYWLLMSTADLGEDSKIWGFIYDTYCGSCGKNIKTYLIMENDFSKDKAVEILKREIYEIANKQLSEICHIDIRNDCVCLLKYNYIFECFQDFQYYVFEDYDTREDAIDAARKNADNMNEEIIETLETTCYNIIFSEELVDAKINCPICGVEQSISFHEENCPKCGNRLEVSTIIFD